MGRQRVYPSDLTNQQWETIEPMLPLIKEPGADPEASFRDIVDAILYLDRSGCSWRQLPVDFPPWQTVYGWFQRWKARGVAERILEEQRFIVTDTLGLLVSVTVLPRRGRTATAPRRRCRASICSR
ncbi:transposase [Actinoplanes sp. M2I2]|uniref:transposase n=1 Tax=Actinoplanes sp. M2I2 TaxID=1734444 RepID=UPI0020217F57|nr:transposase [Actinoplanes sp. M2I2]